MKPREQTRALLFPVHCLVILNEEAPNKTHPSRSRSELRPSEPRSRDPDRAERVEWGSAFYWQLATDDCSGFTPNPPPSRSSHREHAPAEPLPPADIPNPSMRDTRPAADVRAESPVFLVAAPHGRWWLRWVKYRTARSRHRARSRCAFPVALPERFATLPATCAGRAASPTDAASR